MEVLTGDPLLVVGLVLLGLVTGVVTGLFGIGGAFITTPILIDLIGLQPSLAVGCSMGFTLVNGMYGLRRHAGKGHIETRVMLWIGAAACLGTAAGFQFHYLIKQVAGTGFSQLVNLIYVAVLLPIGGLVWWQSRRHVGQPWLSRWYLPPMIRLKQKDLPPVSLALLCLIGLTIGIAKGLVGIGGGIILVPVLVLVAGLTPQRAVGISLGMVLLSSLVGTALYAWRGDVNVLYVLAMLCGSLPGVAIGTRLCHLSTPERLKQLLAILIFVFSALLIGLNLGRSGGERVRNPDNKPGPLVARAGSSTTGDAVRRGPVRALSGSTTGGRPPWTAGYRPGHHPDNHRSGPG